MYFHIIYFIHLVVRFSVFSESGARVLVDDVSIDFLRGATIDYVDQMIKNAFVVSSNPNSESSCGCKTSFALKA